MARILVVDDDPDILKLAEKVLASAGHMVFVAEDAMRALEWLNHVEFDLMLSDVNMPHYSGFELVHTVKQNSKFRNLSIAMLTGLRERKDVERALKVGVDDYIVKPIDPLLLMQKVSQLLEKRPPVHSPEITITNPEHAKATMVRELEVKSVSELGVRVVSETPLKPGSVLDIQCEFFKSLNLQPPPMKVLTATTDAVTGLCHAQLIFLGARENFLQPIRRWLYQHGSSSKAS